jgi:hypothetical protein
MLEENTGEQRYKKRFHSLMYSYFLRGENPAALKFFLPRRREGAREREDLICQVSSRHLAPRAFAVKCIPNSQKLISSALGP